MQEIDPRFKAAKVRAERRSRKSVTSKALMVGSSVLMVVALAAIGAYLLLRPDPELEVAGASDEVEEGAYVSPFIDIAGDPMVLRLEAAGGASTTLLPPVELEGTRVTGDIILISDIMIASEGALIATVPTSREDFAFFQSQRAVPSGNGAEEPADETSTSLRLTPEHLRPHGTGEMVIRLAEPASGLAETLAGGGIDGEFVPMFESALSEQIDLAAHLGPGGVVAARYVQDGIGRVPMQVSIYGPDGYAGSAALDDLGQSVLAAADPWVDEDISQRGRASSAGTAGRKYRLMDAVYSTGLRNGMPAALLGEAMVLLSKAFDTDAFAQAGDRLLLAYSTGSSQGAAAQILYVAIDRSKGKPLKCYVERPGNEPDFRCWGDRDTALSSGPRLRPGLSPPVSGVLRAAFGPRNDPDTGRVEVHPGVDWAAPKGSDVRVAMAGTVVATGDDPRYGLTVEVGHDNGVSTFYGHLDSVAAIGRGDRLSPGSIIGTVGTTGNTKVPHLHFEYRENGKAEDPFIRDAGGLAGEAVGALVDQIIKVESGGRACVKAATSSATGLGQFIESTWIRMMKTYRADLYASLDREELLALRCDPTLSYEMVTNLAREGEAYLTARGHEVTAGRLYLAHFLGARSASDVLAADDEAAIADVVGDAVVDANKFLKGRDIQYIKAWADRKMRGRSKASAPPPPPAHVASYMALVDQMLAGG